MKSDPGIQVNESSFRDVNQYLGIDDENEEATPPVRVLFLAACPFGTLPLRLDQEVKTIQEGLWMSKNGGRFEVEQSWAVGDRELQDGLLRYSPDIVHLSGHGGRTCRIRLEEDSAARDLGPRPTSTPPPENLWLQGLVRIFAAARGRIRCVVLNACHSEPIVQALAQVVGCVVGMSDAIEDAAVIRFSWSFYNAIGDGRSLRSAFDLAMGQLALGDLRTSDVPRLVTAGVAPDGVTFL